MNLHEKNNNIKWFALPDIKVVNTVKHRVRQTDQGSRAEIFRSDPCIEEKLDLRQSGGKEELLFMLIYKKSFSWKKNVLYPQKSIMGKQKTMRGKLENIGKHL